MKTIRNISVIDRRAMILESLPSDTDFSFDDVKSAIRASGMISKDAIRDYLDIHLAPYIVKEGDVYRLK